MIGVETIARIRFEHFQNRKGIKRIARELGIARDTVRKVLRSGATEFSYKRTVQPQPKLGLWVETLTAILEAEAKLPRRERRSTIRLFEELRGRGYDGAHDSVHRFVKAWRADTPERRPRLSSRCGSIRAKPTSSTGATRRSSCRPASDGEAGADAALVQPHAVRARLSRETQEMVFTRTTGPSPSMAGSAGAASTTI